MAPIACSLFVRARELNRKEMKRCRAPFLAEDNSVRNQFVARGQLTHL